MKTILVDDEPVMLRFFSRISEGLPGLELVGSFRSSADALEYARDNIVELAFLDIQMPEIDGIELAKKLQKIHPGILIVFITGSDSYIRQSNKLGVDYYLLKPYNRKILSSIMERMALLSSRQKKAVHIQTFGSFSVQKNGKPIPLTGRAKEILAYIVASRGKEVSNRAIYSALWENRPYSNHDMAVYYNALRRLKTILDQEGLSSLLVSTQRGQMLDVSQVDCDYYSWLEKDPDRMEFFDGEFLTEYSWSEEILGNLFGEFWQDGE